MTAPVEVRVPLTGTLSYGGDRVLLASLRCSCAKKLATGVAADAGILTLRMCTTGGDRSAHSVGNAGITGTERGFSPGAWGTSAVDLARTSPLQAGEDGNSRFSRWMSPSSSGPSFDSASAAGDGPGGARMSSTFPGGRCCQV
jgi:hypothetical protein